MKKIGLIGGIPTEKTIEYYKLLTRKYNRIKGGVNSPDIIIDSLNFQKVTNWLDEKNIEDLLDYLEESAQRLISAGAEIIIIAANNPHIIFHELEKRIEKATLSIMKATAMRVENSGLKKIGLIGTQFTMSQNFYHKTFSEHSIEILVPAVDQQKILDQLYWEELAYNKITNETKKKYLEIIQELVEKGAEGIILSDREISQVLKAEECLVPLFDSTTIHVESVLNLAMDV